jgi:hypothetical protein
MRIAEQGDGMTTAAATVEPVNFLEKTESEKRARKPMVGASTASGIAGAIIPPDPETPRRRSRHRLEHLPDHRQRHHQHGHLFPDLATLML